MTADPRWYLNRLRRCRQVFLGESALAPALPLPAGEDPPFLRAIAYREGRSRDDGALARLHRLTGLESLARACEMRVLQPAALVDACGSG